MSANRVSTVVLVAFAANPEMSSETGIGWLYVRQALRHLKSVHFNGKIYIICNERSASSIREPIRIEFSDCVRFEIVGIGMPRSLTFLETNPQLTRIEYLVWNRMAKHRLRRVRGGGDVILAQHVTFATEMLPTPISVLKHSSFNVWGPVGAAGDSNVYKIPPISKYSRKELKTQRARDVLASLAIRAFGRRVSLAVAQNKTVEARFTRAGFDCITFPNVIVNEQLRRIAADTAKTPMPLQKDRLELVCVGHQIARKRFEIAIAALNEHPLADARLTLIGAPLPGSPNYLPAVAEELGVSDRVIFAGKLPRSEVLLRMCQSDVLVHPSAREGASGVVGEATTVGLPVFCFAGTGASSVLDASGGSGVALDASGATPLRIATAIADCAKLPRILSSVWTEDRFSEFFSTLYESAGSIATGDVRENNR